MSLFKERWEQFLEYLKYQRKESMITGKFVTKYKEDIKIKEEYEQFKGSILDTINTLFSSGKSEVWIKPNKEQIELYEKLMRDEEFNSNYHCEVKEKDKLAIRVIEI